MQNRHLDKYRALWESFPEDADTAFAKHPVYEEPVRKTSKSKVGMMLQGLSMLTPGPTGFEQMAKMLQATMQLAGPQQAEWLHSFINAGPFGLILQFGRRMRKEKFTYADVYQGGRNFVTVMVLNYLLNGKVEATESMYAYSGLYVVTDNFLDDPSVPASEKKQMCEELEFILRGDRASAAEKKTRMWDPICKLIDCIEGEWPREQHPLVYEALLFIHHTQIESLRLHDRPDIDVLALCFEKGGASVVSDGYLVAPEKITFKIEEWLYGFGLYAQLVDDLEDLDEDIGNKHKTLFTCWAKEHRNVDPVVNKLMGLGDWVANNAPFEEMHFTQTMKDLFVWGIPYMTAISARRARGYCSKDLNRRLSAICPITPCHAARLQTRFLKYHARIASRVDGFVFDDRLPAAFLALQW
eukprot:TRINITY_DN4394_c0_g1_i1.p1 TRINITY_DN4394_c0_g1~~TRINITY_DN4394_c0_g1_i1.p1  ORF type:complete len:442 (+),score=122.74 TRINITY_DN4394_c0_g1_i1:92-1327(+)